MAPMQLQNNSEKLKWQEAKGIFPSGHMRLLGTFFDMTLQRDKGQLGWHFFTPNLWPGPKHENVLIFTLGIGNFAQSSALVSLHSAKVRFEQIKSSPFGLEMEYASVNMRMCFSGKYGNPHLEISRQHLGILTSTPGWLKWNLLFSIPAFKDATSHPLSALG